MIAIVIPTLDAAKGELVGKLALLSAGCDARVIVINGPKRGFTKTVNDGLQQTTDEDVCILNDDILRFQHGWLKTLQRALYSNARYGIVGPSGKSAGKSGGGRAGMSGLEIVGQLSFWCVLIRRAVVTDIGILDERFIHYCSDNEYCQRARKHGWLSVWVKEAYLEHKHHGSGLRSDWKQHDQHALRILRRKGG